MVISALPPSHCRVILALLRESALPSVAVGGVALGPLGRWGGFLFGGVYCTKVRNWLFSGPQDEPGSAPQFIPAKPRG